MIARVANERNERIKTRPSAQDRCWQSSRTAPGVTDGFDEFKTRYGATLVCGFAHITERLLRRRAFVGRDVIDPLDTRKILALGLSAALNAPIQKTAFSVFRM